MLPPPPETLPLGDVGNMPKETETTKTSEERDAKNKTTHHYFPLYPHNNVSPFPPPGYYLNPPPNWEEESESPPNNKGGPCPYPGGTHNPPFGYALPPWPTSPYYSHPNSDRSSCKIMPPCFGRWPPKDPYEGEPPPFGLYQIIARPRYHPPQELYDVQQDGEESEEDEEVSSKEVSTQGKGGSALKEVPKKRDEPVRPQEKAARRQEEKASKDIIAEETTSAPIKEEGAKKQNAATTGYVYKPRPKVVEDPATRRKRKNAQARARAARNRERLIALEAKPDSERTAEEKAFLAKVLAKRARKNNRSRNRAAENKIEMERISQIPEKDRTQEEIKFLAKMLTVKKRKNEGDVERRKRIKMGLMNGDFDLSEDDVSRTTSMTSSVS